LVNCSWFRKQLQQKFLNWNFQLEEVQANSSADLTLLSKCKPNELELYAYSVNAALLYIERNVIFIYKDDRFIGKKSI
jgi:hypothetical protein